MQPCVCVRVQKSTALSGPEILECRGVFFFTSDSSHDMGFLLNSRQVLNNKSTKNK